MEMNYIVKQGIIKQCKSVCISYLCCIHLIIEKLTLDKAFNEIRKSFITFPLEFVKHSAFMVMTIYYYFYYRST